MTSPEIAAALNQGVRTLSAEQTVLFTQYVRTVLPVDGFVFWVRNNLLNNDLTIATPAPTIEAKGSLHFAAEKRQTATGSVTVTRVVFTTQTPIHQDIEDTNPPVIYIGSFDGIRFSFSSFKNYYRQADTWHYIGDAIYADMLSQIVDDRAQFDDESLIISDSMPFWLMLSNYVPSEPAYGFSSPVILYPSFLVPSNIAPPYASVEITGTEAIAAVPFETSLSSDYQLTRERAKVTTYGLRNEQARRLLMCVLQRSQDYDEFGILNAPVVRDEKQNQVELGITAMRKSIEFEISYYQGAARNVARQLITRAIPKISPVDPNFAGLLDPVTGRSDVGPNRTFGPAFSNTFG